MSRNYGEYCEGCKRCDARTDRLSDTLVLAQCLDCGECHVTIEKFIKLKTKGTNEISWRDAKHEAYDLLLQEGDQ